MIFLKKKFFAHIFYKWRNNAKIFIWVSIFDNCYTKDNMLYLRDVSTKLLYTTDGKNVYWHKHIIWITNYNINRIQLSPYLYIEGTFISTKDFYQLIIFMYYDELSNKKYRHSIH